MSLPYLEYWFKTAPLVWLGVILLAAMMVAATIGRFLRAQNAPADKKEENHEGYIVSAVLGLLALLTGFTFSLAVVRFETRS